MDSAMPTGQRRELPASLAGFLLLSATVYVPLAAPQAALMSQRRLPCGTLIFLYPYLHYFLISLLLSCCKLVSLVCPPELDRLRVVLVSPRNPLNIAPPPAP